MSNTYVKLLVHRDLVPERILKRADESSDSVCQWVIGEDDLEDILETASQQSTVSDEATTALDLNRAGTEYRQALQLMRACERSIDDQKQALLQHKAECSAALKAYEAALKQFYGELYEEESHDQ